MTKGSIDSTRRCLLASIAGIALAPGIVLVAAPASAADSAKRWGMLVDVNKCAGDCSACVVACKDENGWTGHDRPATDAQWIRKVNVKNPATGAGYSLPVMCQHCENPPCADVCPTGASFKRADGIVLVDKHICIGCRYCMMACPYKARSFVHERVRGQKTHAPRGQGTVEACTMCVHRVDAGKIPACVEACNREGQGAFLFGDLNDASSDIAREVAKYPVTRIRADLGLKPGVLYRGLEGS